ncbi:MAG: YCF48-related protein, partial [Acidobacteriota bacterium]
FVSDNEGWTAGAGATLLHTTNGGSAWTPVVTGAEAARGFNTVRFLDQNTGFAGGATVVARTINGGANWTLATLPSTLPLINNNMLNVLHTSVFPLAATQFWTSGGGTFQNQGVAGATMALYEINAGGQLSLLAPIGVGNLSGNIKSINDVQFFSTVSGLGVGDVGLIVKAELQQPTPLTFPTSGTTQQLNAIFMVNASNGWVVGNGGVILTTTNGGAAWTLQTSGTAANLRDVHFVDASRGWAVGDGGVILTTGNGGGTWTPETSGVTADLRGVFFASAGTGYAVGANGTILKRTGTTSGSTVTTVSAASFTGGTLAPDSIAAAFGTTLATTTQSAAGLPLPTTLAGTTVKVRDSQGIERNAPLFFVSPGQINYLIPTGSAVGTADITVTNDQSGTATGTISIAAVAPGLFTANANGTGVAAAVALRVRADGSQSFEPVSRFDAGLNSFVSVPIALGPATDQVFLLLYGTGLRNRSALAAVTATIGGTNSEVSFAGQQPDFVGLDQINVRVPRSLAGRGEVDIVLMADGRTANTVRINIGAASGSSAPVIANLTLNNPTMNGTTASISGRLDFTDSDGDIAFNGNTGNSAFVRFQVIFGQAGCTGGVTGFFLHFPGQTSGTINFGGSYTFSNPITQPVSVQIRLVDVAGNGSNTLTANVNQWFCSLPMEFELKPEADWLAEPVWPAWMIRTRRRDLAG